MPELFARVALGRRARKETMLVGVTPSAFHFGARMLVKNKLRHTAYIRDNTEASRAPILITIFVITLMLVAHLLPAVSTSYGLPQRD